jgi:hypothetical protein
MELHALTVLVTAHRACSRSKKLALPRRSRARIDASGPSNPQNN